MAANGDLWMRAWTAIQALEVSFSICHVPSHEDPEGHEDPVAEWLVRQNNYLDQVAAAAREIRDQDFWTTWERFKTEADNEARTHDTVVDFHSKVAGMVMSTQAPNVLESGPPIQIRGTTVLQWTSQQGCSDRTAGAYGFWFAHLLEGWSVTSAGSLGSICFRTLSWTRGRDHQFIGRRGGETQLVDQPKACICGTFRNRADGLRDKYSMLFNTKD